MIIVKTKNGSVLINDMETHLVEHIKDKSMVVVRSDQHKVNANIRDVESVTYVNDAHATEWKDEGLEIEQLKAELENEKRENHIMCEHFGFIREWFFIYQNAFDDIKNAAVRSKNGSKCEDTVIDSLIEQAEKKYAESQKRFEKVREQWDKKGEVTMPKIECTEKTSNPIHGCTKVSETCQNYYAKVMAKRLRDCDLSVRCLCCLKAAELETVRDLCRCKKTDLLKFRNFGKRSLMELEEFLEKNGLTWEMDV